MAIDPGDIRDFTVTAEMARAEANSFEPYSTNKTLLSKAMSYIATAAEGGDYSIDMREEVFNENILYINDESKLSADVKELLSTLRNLGYQVEFKTEITNFGEVDRPIDENIDVFLRITW